MILLIPGYFGETFEDSHQYFFHVFDVLFVDHFDQRVVFAVKVKADVSVLASRGEHRYINDAFLVVMGKLNVICSLIEQKLNIRPLTLLVLDQNQYVVILFS